MQHINENAKIKNVTYSWDNTSFLRENNFTYHKKKNMFFTNVLLRNIKILFTLSRHEHY